MNLKDDKLIKKYGIAEATRLIAKMGISACDAVEAFHSLSAMGNPSTYTTTNAPDQFERDLTLRTLAEVVNSIKEEKKDLPPKKPQTRIEAMEVE